MKLLLPIIFLMPVFLFATEETDERKVSDLSINELKEIVRLIVEESIEQCTVTGTMQGRAKVNLKVEGEVVVEGDLTGQRLRSCDTGHEEADVVRTQHAL